MFAEVLIDDGDAVIANVLSNHDIDIVRCKYSLNETYNKIRSSDPSSVMDKSTDTLDLLAENVVKNECDTAPVAKRLRRSRATPKSSPKAVLEPFVNGNLIRNSFHSASIDKFIGISRFSYHKGGAH